MKNVLLQAIIVRSGKQMEIINSISTARETVKRHKLKENTVGLVPTMGALHDGHLSLVMASVDAHDITIVTIFVNPIQFNNAKDLQAYPTSLEADIDLLRKNGCDYVFIPSQEEMYSEAPVVNFNFGNLETTMEGVFRPGHFSGVALVVMKLFNILQPTTAYFGQKDLQQFKVIEKMVEDTSMDINLKMMPIIREKSGLALSSRNRRLSKEANIIAPEIYRMLRSAVDNFKNGARVEEVISMGKKQIAKYPHIKLEYLTIVNLEDLQTTETVNGEDHLVLCFAGYIGEIRLIDNIIIN